MNLTNPGPGRQCRIIFLDGAWMDFVPSPDFNFAVFVTSAKAAGHILADQAYIRFDLIRCILMWDESNPPLDVHAPQNAPSTGTKQ